MLGRCNTKVEGGMCGGVGVGTGGEGERARQRRGKSMILFLRRRGVNT